LGGAPASSLYSEQHLVWVLHRGAIGGWTALEIEGLVSWLMHHRACEAFWIAAEVSRLEVLIQRFVSSCWVSKALERALKAPEQDVKAAERTVARQVPGRPAQRRPFEQKEAMGEGSSRVPGSSCPFFASGV
jgi:hypothetical protein